MRFNSFNSSYRSDVFWVIDMASYGGQGTLQATHQLDMLTYSLPPDAEWCAKSENRRSRRRSSLLPVAGAGLVEVMKIRNNKIGDFKQE